ncbi:hypothetical protein SNEBB_008330 [Seison nebaliae]|nr:hypothetical protein SNEBB_008330 [Seison nebaliae]
MTDIPRLDTKILPRHYDLAIKSNLYDKLYEGSVRIEFDVEEETDKVILHAVDMDISSVTFKSEEYSIKEFDVDGQTLDIMFNKNLVKKKGYEMQIEFDGKLSDKMKGFYFTNYKLENDDKEYVGGVTQFESNDARRAFPCWDEPSFKATFSITITFPDGLTGLSNMEPINEEVNDSMKTIKFNKTPIMSTYLLAWVIGHYECIEGRSSENILVRCWSIVGQKERLKFALNLATKALTFYSNYFSIPYPLNKLDLIAVPDFAAGAMENWGCVTYRDVDLLIDEKKSTIPGKIRVAMTVAHEIAHMWFGNLVTMKWWKHLWLNEGFASWMQHFCVNEFFPEFDVWTDFISHTHNAALYRDSLANTHAIEVEVKNSEEDIAQIFDTISYCKGAALIRMLHAFIGDEAFRKGLSIYLKRHAYSNTETEDLWKCFTEASKVNVNELMNGWTTQKGYPMVRVDLSEPSNKQVKVKFTQNRFCSTILKDNENYLWHIPIFYEEDGEKKHFVLKEKEQTIQIKERSVLKINTNCNGFYVVEYPMELLNEIARNQIGKSTISDRISLHNDLFFMVTCDRKTIAQYLEFLQEFYSNETNYFVWSDIMANLGQIRLIISFMDNEELMGKFKKYYQNIVRTVYKRLTWNEIPKECQTDKMLRPLVITQMGRMGDQETVELAKKDFNNYYNKIIHNQSDYERSSDLISATFNVFMADGDKTSFDKMIQIYDHSELSEQRVRIIRCLGYNSYNEEIRKLCIGELLGNRIRRQDAIYCFVSLAGLAPGKRFLWHYFKDNYATLRKELSSELVCRCLSIAVEQNCDDNVAGDVQKFFDEHEPLAESCISQTKELADTFARIKRANYDSLFNYFKVKK